MPKRKKSKLPLILFIILIVIIAGVAAMYFYTQINNDILGKNQSNDTYTLVIEKKDFEQVQIYYYLAEVHAFHLLI